MIAGKILLYYAVIYIIYLLCYVVILFCLFSPNDYQKNDKIIFLKANMAKENVSLDFRLKK